MSRILTVTSAMDDNSAPPSEQTVPSLQATKSTPCAQETETAPPDAENKINHRDLWNKIIQESEDQMKELRAYQRPILDPPPHPEVDYLNETVFPVLDSALITMLKKVKEQETKEGDTYLNTLNFIAEFLWNMNPLHPERCNKWTDIVQVFGKKYNRKI